MEPVETRVLAWLASHGDALEASFVYAVASALRADMLNVNRDAEALAIFADWLREAPESPEFIGMGAGFLKYLRHEFPSQVWGTS